MSAVHSLVLDSSLLPFSPIESFALSSLEQQNVKMTKPARKLLHECVAKMVMVLGHEVNSVACDAMKNSKRKREGEVVILREEHLEVGLKNLGFHEEYMTRTKQKMSDFGEVKSRKKSLSGKKKQSAYTPEELAKMQKDLFDAARMQLMGEG